MTASSPTPPTPVVSSTQPQRIVVVAESAEDLEPVAKHLRGLALGGHQIVLVWRAGTPGRRLDRFGARVQLSTEPPTGVRQRARQVLTTRSLATPGRLPLAAAVLQDSRAARQLDQADALVLAGADAVAAADELGTAARPVISRQELAQWEMVSGIWRRLENEVAGGQAQITPPYVRSLLRQAHLLGGRVPETRQHLLVPVVQAMHLSGRYELAHDVARLLSVGEKTDPVDGAHRRGLLALTQTSATGTPAPALHEVAEEVVRAADLTLEGGDVERTVDLVTLALGLLFHRELHADGLSSPLVQDPDAFLEVWRASRVGTLLASTAPREPALPSRARRPHTDNPRPRVVVVPGSYPQFSVPVIEALQERAEVRVVDLADRADLRGLGTWRSPVDARLRQVLGGRALLDYEVLEEMEAADAVFVDWADRGALATVMAVPQGVPLTLRVHSMDALSPWLHLLDWSRVDHLVVVSEPIRRLVEQLLGERLSRTRVHVVPNVVDLSRVPTHKTEGHLRRLVMVGWGQQVKDPSWALDVLALLRQEDTRWRLTLVGTDFPNDPVRSQREYAAAFRARLAQDDVCGAVDVVGYTRDVAPHLAAAGFVLSTSRRESFGLGLVEAAASGAVPVVRDWPIYAPLDAARSLFPHHWVVETVQEAADRIRSLAQEPHWAPACEEARREVAERFSSGDARATIQELVLPAGSGSAP